MTEFDSVLVQQTATAALTAMLDSDEQPNSGALAVEIARAVLSVVWPEIYQQASSTGWNRAHTMLCSDLYPVCKHRNPWHKARATKTDQEGTE